MAKYMTSQRKKLLDFLKSNHGKQLSAAKIAEALSVSGISQSAIYRNLSALEEDGLVSRHTKEGFREIFYSYTGAEQCKNCIHLTCTKCGKVTHMNSEAARQITDSLRRTAGFNINKSKTVVYGLCHNCE
ncbi:MAG: transcriptional repressor [Clostridia bacterium]|nr:transcriptional repressor [Clostridia bacterium]